MNIHPGWIAVIGILIALGLVLKFGGSSVKLGQVGTNALVGETNALLMSNNPGNLPPGVHTA